MPQKHRILLVDDEPHVIEGLKRVLYKESLEILTAGSAEEALKVLKKESVDVIISDEKMPGMKGCEFLARAYENYPETIRIILTGHADLEIALKAINLGQIYRFLLKPVNELELKVTLRQAIQHKELMAESRRLLYTVRRQQAILQELEKENPGITKIKRDEMGVIILEEPDYDPDSLIEKINQELKNYNDLTST